MMLKVFELYNIGYVTRRKWSLRAIEYLLHLMGLQYSCCEWLVKEIIRFRTFQELELEHTCCQWRLWSWRWGEQGSMIKLDPEEIVDLREEDHENIELHETLLQEFEEKRGDQDLLSFLKGY